MSYAIKNDLTALRSVSGPEDVLEGEFYSEDIIELVQLPATRQEVEASRLRAYADPVLGCDRYFAEAARLEAMGADQEEVDAARSAGALRYAQIRAEHPWPIEVS